MQRHSANSSGATARPADEICNLYGLTVEVTYHCQSNILSDQIMDVTYLYNLWHINILLYFMHQFPLIIIKVWYLYTITRRDCEFWPV